MENKILDFSNLQLIYESDKTIVYRAIKESSNQPVILKLPRSHLPTSSEIVKLVHSFEITKNIDIPGIIKTYALEKVDNKIILVLEDIGGISLREYLKDNTLDLISFLKVAISLADTLGNIHLHKIIQKDIKPENIIINAEKNDVRISDFGISTRLSHENPKVINRNILEGTLNYISPEQTGRMNRGIDYRTDIYSLGVTFYEMTTGQLPFKSQDSLELIHLHIAKTPISPHELKPSIPKVISDIIMKCLAKMPEDRYHSAYGLKNDLEECLRQVLKNNTIEAFSPGKFDIYDVFRIPQVLYGRQREIEALLESFDHVCNGATECIMISGYAGIGKTSLVNEVQKPIVKQRGYFVSGKFDQLKKDVPYSGLILALTDLIHQALTESETDLTILKHKLLGTLHNNGQILIDLIPELELIIGKQPLAPSLGARENQNRLKMLFKSFIHVFSKKEHPLVIFLDDLQWAGHSTLVLVKELITDPTIQHLLLIGSYREQEVSHCDPLILTLEEIKKEKGDIHELTLTPLTPEDIKQFTVDTLHCSYERGAPLAQILHQKSGGNPFYLIQFLKKLHQENFINFNSRSKEWDWDLARIQELEVAENVIDLITKKIQQLPQQTQSILSVAAAIGLSFDLRILALESNLSLSTALRILWNAITEEIIQPIGENYHLIESKELETVNADKIASTEINFEFIHDRVQQVSYGMMSEEKKVQVHYKLGKILQQRPFSDQLEENIYEITSHLNLGSSLITNETERLDLAKMNLKVSRRAKNAAAYTTAFDCIKVAQSLLPEDAWKSHYELTYQTYLEMTECSYLTQHFENIDNLSSIILKNAKTNLEKGNLYIIKIIFYTNIGQTQTAIDQGLECLNLFGIKYTTNPNPLSILFELFRIKWRLWKTPIASLEHLPEIKDPELLFIMKVLVNLCAPAFIADKKLLGLIALKMMAIMLDHGSCDQSFFVYLSYATLLELVFRDYEKAYELGELSLKVAERTNNNTFKCRANFVMASIINHWKNPLHTSEKYMHACYSTGMESGEVMYVSFVSVFWGFLEGSYFSNLTQALRNLRRYKNTIFSIKSRQPMHSFYTKEGLLLAFKDPEFRGDTIKYENFDEIVYHEILRGDLDLQVAYQAYVAYRMVLYHIFGKNIEGLKLFDVSESTRKCINALSQERELNLYHSLILAALYPKATFWEKIKYKYHIKKNQRLLKRWADFCPANSAHRYTLVQAELAKINGNFTEALQLYDKSGELAKANQYYIEEAIATEKAGLLCLELDKKFIAKAYLEHAYDAWNRADALSKVHQLEEDYPDILLHKQQKRLHSAKGEKSKVEKALIIEGIHSSTSEGTFIDLASVIHATSLITGQIHLETLLKQLMKIVVENAGADRAFLFREVNGRWLIQAEKDLINGTSSVLQSLPFEKEADLFSIIIIQYVIRTKQTVVLNDAIHMGMFTEDPYINSKKPKSVLCFPLSHQGKLSSILYFENNSTTDAFTPDRLDILQLLSGQIATSIENASLYSNLETATENLKAFNAQLEDYNRNLETKVDERTKELQYKNEQLRDTLNTLKEMQKQVLQQEKLAALGSLTQGIAHEIKNPLNFINNFSSLSVELLEDLYKQISEASAADSPEEVQNLINHLKVNLQKIHDHSLRVDGIVVSMLKHSKETKGQKDAINLNQLLKEYLALSTKTYAEKHPNIKIDLETNFDPNLRLTNIVSQDIGRGILNILDNAYYAVAEKREIQGDAFTPKVSITSKQLEDSVEILIRDNGLGIPKENREKLFHPFFTTKPTGTGTGLGLSIAYDIVVQEHAGEIKVNTEEGAFTEFIIHIPNKGSIDSDTKLIQNQPPS